MNEFRLTLLALLTVFGGRLAAQTYALSFLPVAGTFEAVSIAADRNGSIVFADGYATVGRLSSEGIATVLAGAARQLGSVDGVGAAARFSRPTGVVLDSAGNIFVWDAGNLTVRKIAPGGIVTTLAGQAGIAETVVSPSLTLVDSSGRVVAVNTGWSTGLNSIETAQAAGRVGAFPFAPGSLDSALFVTLVPGAYTALVTGEAGIALVEVYDADGAETEGSRTVNISTRAPAGAGEGRLIAGFVISGAATRQVLIRAIGPSLAQFGVSGTLSEPQIELFDHRGQLLQRAGAWREQFNAGEIQTSAVIAGAFPLGEDSRDAAILTHLWPGSFTVQVTGREGTATGVALVEVYELP